MLHGCCYKGTPIKYLAINIPKLSIQLRKQSKEFVVNSYVYCVSQYTECGIYLLRLCKDGCWTVIQVDDYLPCNKDRMLVFSKVWTLQHDLHYYKSINYNKISY